MNIPKKIKIGAIWYDVKRSHLPDDWGCVTRGKQLITISDEITGEYRYVNLLHEIIHAINHEIDEKDVVTISNGLYQVLKENKIF